MTVYTATGSGLSEANTGLQNRAALFDLAAVMVAGDELEVDGFFTYDMNGLTGPLFADNTTLRAATPGSTAQGFDVVGTIGNINSHRAFRFGTGMLMQGLTFTASDTPAIIPGNRGVSVPGDRHMGGFVAFGSNSVLEYCSFTGMFGSLVAPYLSSNNVTIRNCALNGSEAGLLLYGLTNSLVSDCWIRGASTDGIKFSNNGQANNCLLRKLYVEGHRDCIDLACYYTNITIEDSVLTNAQVAAIDTKSSAAWIGTVNKNLDVNRVRFVANRRSLAMDYLDSEGFSLEHYLFHMPQDLTFTDCSFETPPGGASDRMNNMLVKGGDFLTVVRPKYYGQQFEAPIGISYAFSANWPPGWSPTNLDDGDASKEIFAARAAPTMDLEAGPAFFTGEGNPNVAPILSNVAISPSGGPVGTVLTPSFIINAAAPAPTYTYIWKRGATTVATSQNYTSQAADVGEDITLTMTASNVAGTSSPAASAAVSITAPAALPAISGDTLTLLATAPT